MTMAAAVLSALLLWQGAGKTVGDLIRDLGADEYSVRERAESDLRKLGDAAIPALREALEDKDPERALRAHRVLESLEKKGVRPSGSRAWMAYRDFVRGITFETHPDGKVELTVREPGADGAKRETRTYRADSTEDFKKKYPELAAQYNLDNLAPRETWSVENDWFPGKDAPWTFAMPWFPFSSGALAGKPQLGIIVERISSALSDQLGLGPDEGLLITEVKPSSRAERSGLRKHDILLKADGKTLDGPDDLRREVQAGLKKGMELEILRRGKRETLKVEPAAQPPK